MVLFAAMAANAVKMAKHDKQGNSRLAKVKGPENTPNMGSEVLNEFTLKRKRASSDSILWF